MYYSEIVPYFNKYFETIKGSRLLSVIKYSIEDGKCIRGFIVKHIIETLLVPKENSDKLDIILWEPIVAIELIHAASLIIDDLPCMDNDMIRRNKPSTFIKFGEREAILSSFYLISQSCKLLVNSVNYNKVMFENKPDLVIKLLNEWCELLGENLVVGQLMDLNEDIKTLLNINIVENNKTLMIYKTASLFIFSFLLGGVFSYTNIDIEEFKVMGTHFGIMFQLMDDINDVEKDKARAQLLALDTSKIIHTNFINANGQQKAIKTFNESRTILRLLLKKNKLYTPEFKKLIKNISMNFNKNKI